MVQVADFSAFQVGAIYQPLDTKSPNTLLQDADPVLFFALSFWSFVINTYPGPRLLQALRDNNVLNQQGQQIDSAVAQAFPYMPQPTWLENQLKLPLLAAWRTRTVSELKTAGWEHDGGHLDVIYVLPPMTAAQTENVLPILNTVEKALRWKTTYGFDPGYAPPGGTQGQQPWGINFAHVEYIGFGDPYTNRGQIGEYGGLEGSGNLYFPCLKMHAFFLERDTYVPGVRKFAGADITGNLVAGDGTTISNFVQGATQQAPTIKTLSVTSGGIAGGTSLTITGTLFLPGPPSVQFGSQFAPTVTYNSSTSITVTTPAMQGPGTVNVTVLNRDGQSAVAPQAFTFV